MHGGGNGYGAGFDDLVEDGGLLLGLEAADKPALLAQLATAAAAVTGIESDAILERLRIREMLGSTGLGNGTAIPHARSKGLSGVVALIARLETPVAFDAIDGVPIDIVVLLLSPEAAGADHLKALARISRTLRDPARLDAIRAARTPEAMRRAIVVPPEARRAA